MLCVGQFVSHSNSRMPAPRVRWSHAFVAGAKYYYQLKSTNYLLHTEANKRNSQGRMIQKLPMYLIHPIFQTTRGQKKTQPHSTNVFPEFKMEKYFFFQTWNLSCYHGHRIVTTADADGLSWGTSKSDCDRFGTPHPFHHLIKSTMETRGLGDVLQQQKPTPSTGSDQMRTQRVTSGVTSRTWWVYLGNEDCF